MGRGLLSGWNRILKSSLGKNEMKKKGGKFINKGKMRVNKKTEKGGGNP